MREWSDWANSFNSYKGLTYVKWYESIVDWKNGKINKPLAPIEVSLDPIHACNLLCQHCNAHRYLSDEDKIVNRMSDNHILDLVRFLAKWGVKGICWGGGGEPTLHSKLGEALLLSRDLGIENSIATNGTLFTDELIDIAVKTCRWIGVSIDASTGKTYTIGRKKNLFNKAIFNLGELATKARFNSANPYCDVSFKFLVFDYNQHEIYKACKLAKQLGVTTFHVRPADFSHQGMGDIKKTVNPYNIKLIERQFKKCHELEDDNFKTYTVVHKFNPDFTPRRRFTQCYASPICIQLCANNNIYLCPDTRHNDFYKLGEHNPPEKILDVWGSKLHYDLVFKKGCSACKSRCTFSPYNEQMEKLFINQNDPMCRFFV